MNPMHYLDFQPEWMVQGKYKDPDSCSFQLYQDIATRFQWEDALGVKPSVVHRANRYSLILPVAGQTIKLGSDYFGPSICWAQKADVDWRSFIREARTLGGHVAWERRNGSVNQRRGGASGVFDRPDLTLYWLKQYFTNQPGPNGLLKAFARDRFLKLFENDFDRFIRFWKLDTFLDASTGQIVDLTTYDPSTGNYQELLGEKDVKSQIPSDTEGYTRFVAGCTHAIDQRNALIFS